LLDAKALAKAKFAALHADPKELARAKVDAAREESEGRFRDLIGGRGTLQFVLEAQERLFDAELAVSDTDEQRVTAHERRWQFAWITEQISESGFKAGRVSIPHYVQTECNRLHAEIQWLEARTRLRKK
jgi:hypothetical protein